MSSKAAIRVEASTQIGTGHVMRCLTLANGIREKGWTVVFICRECPGNLISFIGQEGYRVHRLPYPDRSSVPQGSKSNAKHWTGVPWEIDADQTEREITGKEANVDWLIVDHYGLDARWEECLRPFAKNIMVIDDLANRPHDADLLLDQNLYHNQETRYDALVPSECTKLLGPKYALMRPEFAEERKALRPRDGSVRRVLISFGGGDTSGETAKALEAVSLLNNTDISFDVVVGAVNPSIERLKVMCDRIQNVVLHVQTPRMAQLMTRADLALGAGGTTTWERCAVGLPSVVVTIAENQEEHTKSLAEGCFIISLGSRETVTPALLVDTLTFLLHSPALLRHLSHMSLGLVDCGGTERIVRRLMPQPITLRGAAEADRDDVYLWRNHEDTRRYSFNSAAIGKQDHNRWYAETLASPRRILLIAEQGKKPVGVLHYDLEDVDARVSVYLIPGASGRGLGTAILLEGSTWLKEHRSEVRSIWADVLTGNRASEQAFLNAGFEFHHRVFRKRIDV